VKLNITRWALGWIVALGGLSCANAAPADCGSLNHIQLPDAQITEARAVAPGAFTPADQATPVAIFHDLPAFCRVAGVIRPTPDSQIGFEVWLPDQWNGRYLQAGNGGFAGSINYVGLVPGIANGFAVASTDDGHVDAGTSAKWALGHPEKLIDFGYRAVHLTNVISKRVVQAYYGHDASHTYFSGCSDGGREGLMEAQRFSDDFEGYLVGAAGSDFTGVMTYLLNLGQISSSVEEPLSLTQIESVQRAALASCDAQDGVTDGVIENPLECRFNPAVLQCKNISDGKCLSGAQVKAVTRIYEGAKGRTGQAPVAPGFQLALGNEVDQWPMLIGPVPKGMDHTEPVGELFGNNFWPLIVYGDAKLDFRKLDIVRAAGDARERTGMLLNAVDPNLAAVRAAGKKIIQYHGWADGVVPAAYSTSYYGAVEKYLGGNNRDFYRLFMAPGVQHCGGGPGPNAFGMSSDPRSVRSFDPDRHLLAALVRWVEKGVAPERIVATKYQDDDAAKGVVRTRPLCVWPKVARWSGKGSTDDAQNFTCANPRAP
jgi:feruloyl esterase